MASAGFVGSFQWRRRRRRGKLFSTRHLCRITTIQRENAAVMLKLLANIPTPSTMTAPSLRHQSPRANVLARTVER